MADCILWTGPLWADGYGRVGAAGMAHRLAYEAAHGPIPDGLVIDHLCRVKACVNPDHLEAVTSRENTLRGVGLTAEYARRSRCENGHAFTPENTRIEGTRRRCRACAREHTRRYRERKAAD